MKFLICTQNNRYTTLGKCYQAHLNVDASGFRSASIVQDNGVLSMLTENGEHHHGGFNGIAKFKIMDLDLPSENIDNVYLAQPSLTKSEAQGISIIAALDMMNLNKDMIDRINEAVMYGKSLDFTNNFWETVKTVLRQNNSGNDWIERALALASHFVENRPKFLVVHHYHAMCGTGTYSPKNNINVYKLNTSDCYNGEDRVFVCDDDGQPKIGRQMNIYLYSAKEKSLEEFLKIVFEESQKCGESFKFITEEFLADADIKNDL